MISKKRSQSDMITNILLILVALAAVAIIAVFITNQIRSNTAAATSKANCAKLDIEITKAINAGIDVTIKRNDNNQIVAPLLKITQDGTFYGNSTTGLPGALETITILKYTGTPAGVVLVSGKKVELSVILNDGTPCPNIATATVTAA